MTQPVTVYRWDDPGAPQIGSGNLWPGILNILKKCLVEGYGSKVAAGWTVEYEDVPGNKCVFRNDPVQGSGGYVQFQRYSDRLVWLRHSTSMTGVDEYVNGGYMSSFNLSSSFDGGRWCIIASSTAFYLIFFTAIADYAAGISQNLRECSSFIGDFVSSVKNDPGTFITICGRGQSTTSASNLGNDTSNLSSIGLIGSGGASSTLFGTHPSIYLFSVLSSTDGVLGVYPHHIACPGVSGNGSTRLTQTLDTFGPLPMVDTYVINNVSLISTNKFQPTLRGKLPGLKALPMGLGEGSPAYTYPHILEVSDASYYCLYKHATSDLTSGPGGLCALINLDGWELPNRD